MAGRSRGMRRRRPSLLRGHRRPPLRGHRWTFGLRPFPVDGERSELHQVPGQAKQLAQLETRGLGHVLGHRVASNLREDEALERPDGQLLEVGGNQAEDAIAVHGSLATSQHTKYLGLRALAACCLGGRARRDAHHGGELRRPHGARGAGTDGDPRDGHLGVGVWLARRGFLHGVPARNAPLGLVDRSDRRATGPRLLGSRLVCGGGAARARPRLRCALRPADCARARRGAELPRCRADRGASPATRRALAWVRRAVHGFLDRGDDRSAARELPLQARGLAGGVPGHGRDGSALDTRLDRDDEAPRDRGAARYARRSE